MKRKLASLPQVKVSKGTWFVYFSVINPKTNKLKPIKIYQGFVNCKNDKDRVEWGQRLVAEYTQKLKAGWSPLFDSDKFIYSDQLEYHNFTERFKKQRKASKDIRFYLNEFLNIKKQGLKPKTYSTYVSKLRIFCNWIEHKGFSEFDISEIKNKIILQFFSFLIDERKLDKRSIEKYKQIIHSYFDFLKKKDLLTENPVFDIVKPPKSKDMAARPITKRDMRKLLKLIIESDPQLYLACMFQYYLALRPGQELRKLKIKDIDLYNNTVIVTDENAKTVRRCIDMSEDLVTLCHHFNLQNYNPEFYIFGREKTPGSQHLGHNTLRTRFNKYRDMLNLPKTYKFYSMKHTGAGMLLDAGLTIEELRDHLGHTSIISSHHYVRKHFGNRNQKVIKSFPKPF